MNGAHDGSASEGQNSDHDDRLSNGAVEKQVPVVELWRNDLLNDVGSCEGQAGEDDKSIAETGLGHGDRVVGHAPGETDIGNVCVDFTFGNRSWGCNTDAGITRILKENNFIERNTIR